MLPKLLLTLYLLQLTLTKFLTQITNLNAPLTIKIPESARFTQIKIEYLKKQLQLDTNLNIEIQPCGETTDCNRITLIDSYSRSKEEILLPATTSRIKECLIRHLELYQQKVAEEKLKMASKAQKDSIPQLKSIQAPKKSKNLSTHLSSQEKDDWDRAHLTLTKTQQTTPLKSLTTNPIIDTEPKQSTILKSDKSKTNTTTRQHSEIYQWYFIYIFLSAIVIIGMKYMHWQQERIREEAKQFAQCPHDCNQDEPL